MKIYRRRRVWSADGNILYSHSDYVLLEDDEAKKIDGTVHYGFREFESDFPDLYRLYETRKGWAMKIYFADYTVKSWKSPDLSRETILWESEDAPLSVFKSLPTDRAIQYFKERGVSLAINV